jgi:hypothetical protein
LHTIFGYFLSSLLSIIVWLLNSKEFTNFTYDLTPINKRYLASLIADLVGKPYKEIMAYLNELEGGEGLRNHIRTVTQASDQKYLADEDVYYGRRLGWYAIVRTVKPKIIVETGCDKGLGSCVLIAALIKNQTNGYARYHDGTDINPDAGFFYWKI